MGHDLFLIVCTVLVMRLVESTVAHFAAYKRWSAAEVRREKEAANELLILPSTHGLRRRQQSGHGREQGRLFGTS